MQIWIRVCDLQVIWVVVVGVVIPEMGNCDFWGLWRCSKNGTERRGSADRGGTLRRHFSVNRVLAAACKRAYILRMRRWTVPQLLFLGLAGLYFCDANAGAQFTSHYSCCPPGAFCDYGMKPISRRNSHSPQIYIDSLTFDGPIHLSATRLKQLLTTVKDNKFSTDFTSLKEIEDWLRKPWLDEGYFRVEVSVQGTPVGSGDDGRYAITAHVDEGLQYRVGRIDFRATPGTDYEKIDSWIDGPTLRKLPDPHDTEWVDPYRPVFSLEELRNSVPLREGDVLNVEKIREGLDALKRLYGRRGYIDFVASPQTEIDDEHQTVSLLFDLDEERQYRIGKIEVYGLDASWRNALIWKIKTGDVFNNEAIQAFFDDNQYNFPARSDWAEDPTIVRHPKTGTVDVEFTFKSCSGQ
jgi:hypothetical protein